MKISERLRVISDLIPDNSFILDIGCDHALLDIYTVLNKSNVKAIASDINEGPLKFAKKNIEKYNVSDKVTISLGDGLNSYKDGVDTVIMSGLGSNTIVNILNNGKDKISKLSKLIISSNNDYYFLRKSICDMGFYIASERIVYDNNKYYPIIVFEKGNKRYNDYDFKYGPVLLKNKDVCFINYLKYSRDKLLFIYNSIVNIDSLKKLSLEKEIKYLDKIIDNN